MPENDKKLFLLDAFALIYRAYYAFIKAPRINSKGFNTSAIFGFVNTLEDVLNNENPSHIAVVFDTAAPTERHEDFEDYKANREKMPEDIALSIPIIKEVVRAFNIPTIEKEGYEADDIIGTLAKKAEKAGYTTYMMTPDKDYGQLISENIFMYRPGRKGNKAEVLGTKAICKKFQIENPLQVIDILALQGDAVDNIPGVPGVGEKTAQKLIAEFGSVENLLENTAKLSGKIKENVENNKDKAILSKKLATIILDVPVEFDEQSLLKEEPNEEELLKLFSELEFRALSRRVLNKEIQVAPKSGAQMDLFGGEPAMEETPEISEFATIETTNHDYQIVDAVEGYKKLADAIKAKRAFCFDTETTGLDDLTSQIVALTIAFEPHKAFYVPFSENQEEAKTILEYFKPLFSDENILKIAQNIKYDINILSQYDVKFKGKAFDTMIAHYLLTPRMRHNMDILAETYLHYSPVSIEQLIGKKGKNQKNMRDVPVEDIKEYACEDADITFQLYKYFKDALEEAPETKKVFEEIEMPLTNVLAKMEQEGIRINVSELNDYSVDLQKEIVELESEITEMAGVSFNIDSPKQLGDVLFLNLKIDDKPKKTKTGQFATGEDVLSKLQGKHPIIEKILDYRQSRKLKNTYVDPLPKMLNKKTGRIHTSYLQAVASTGRLSSANPNLQNIPVRTNQGKRIRQAFISRAENYRLLSADYSQIELRIMAALSKEDNMIQAFSNNEDIHSATAAKVFGVEQKDVTREMRSRAKAVNFGIIYGQSAFGLSQNLNISRKEAKEIIDSYFNKYPRIHEYMAEMVETTRKCGYVGTIMGRRNAIPDINSRNAVVRNAAERNAINAPIQGSAADIIKIAMIHIQESIEKQKLQSKMLLQVHDELVFDVVKEEEEQMRAMVIEKMENAVKLTVPLLVEANYGRNWLEAH